MNWFTERINELSEKKDLSTFIFQLMCFLILFLLIATVLLLEEDGAGLYALSILAAGVAFGWCIGIIISPLTQYNNEGATFARVQQLLSSFITGAVAVKVLPLLNREFFEGILNNQLLLSRILYFVATIIFTAIIVYYERVYLDDQDKARLSFREEGLLPGEVSAITVSHINDLLKVCITNKGQAKLLLFRGDSYDPQLRESNLAGGRQINPNASPEKNLIRDIAPMGKFLFIENIEEKSSGKIGSVKLRVI